MNVQSPLKIYGTLGPSCCRKEELEQMLEAGMTGIRLNLSHMRLAEAAGWIEAWHQALEAGGIEKADLLIDLQGRELRIGAMENLVLEEDDFVLVPSQIPLEQEILNALSLGDVLLLDDGKIKLQILKEQDGEILCIVLQGGMLTERKSLKIEGKELSLPPLRTEDLDNLMLADQMKVTGVMVPFVRRAKDLMEIKMVLNDLNLDLKVLAKIENEEGAANIEELMPWCDEIVIARGDLANSVTLEKLPWLQHELEETCKKHGMPYMVVTQMLESMRNTAAPTRAEVNDVFWSVYHGASSIMLTGETAFGLYPVRAMEYFCSIANEALTVKAEQEAKKELEKTEQLV